ncbi:twin-arginine translocase TatA/TatE family subunit [Anaerocolumna aminovalerica]|jgi:sec-independent protein translocase protein TatA|uniref:Sec-independent protein translocase protein TatA n=1 Tax=Anaerocolumna aminovalerica TaxID=1527 RepID=A0A1I5I2Y0_9FIRM|nr:twin-arginine translocase TatA/TatE family subunit [Anaerocolumna aminovalerica]MBU5332984.1 twin-arginine translocase TatA/TatE family subunit [Anaerocolumna aminovalerica]MDU6266108.1 twin-arginine translocase TatA/TatE family subunit [Anaerocolumna aminovalerica]SFO54867.1 Sec-independent protein translocase TatA [Anaerocolumna aminovalerica]
MFGRIGPFELILILCIALVVFGPSKLPQVGRSLGEAIQEFKKGSSQVKKELNSITEDTIEDDKNA